MERAIPLLPVEDLDIAKEFYVQRLGFGVRFEHRGEGRDGLLGVERGSSEAGAVEPHAGEDQRLAAAADFLASTDVEAPANVGDPAACLAVRLAGRPVA